jgi:hypothetical protein
MGGGGAARNSGRRQQVACFQTEFVAASQTAGIP